MNLTSDPTASEPEISSTCGQCHWPGLSDEDVTHRIPSFALDESNTASRTDLTVRVNPGTEAGENGAHWHVQNPVEYISFDHQGQDVAWVGVMRDGQWVEYQADGVSISQEQSERLPRDAHLSQA